MYRVIDLQVMSLTSYRAALFRADEKRLYIPILTQNELNFREKIRPCAH